MGPRRAGLSILLGVAALATAWLLATPPLGGPDEAAHLATAAADVRGQLAKPELNPVAYQRVSLPRTYAKAEASSLCLALGPGPANCQIPAAYCHLLAPSAARCGLPMASGSAVEQGRTYTGRYPPVYFWAVGWPTLLSSTPSTLYAVRVVSFLLCASLVAAAVVLALRRGRRALAAVVAIMATPMAITTMVAVNPNGLELAGAVAMAVGGWLLVEAEGVDRGAQLLTIFGVIALTLSRPLGPLEALAGAVVLIVAAGPERRAVLHRLPRRGLGVLAATWLATVAWIFVFHAFTVLVAPVPPSQRHGRLRYGLEGLTGWPRWLKQAFGDLGYTNVHPPRFAVIAWVAVLALVLVLAARSWKRAPRGQRVAWLVALAWALLTPAAMAVADGRPPVLFYFGRYGLVPITFAVVVSLGMASHANRLPRWTALLGGLALAGANLSTLAGALHYWTVGQGRPWLANTSVPGAWQPPLGTASVVGLAVLGLGLLGLGAAGQLASDPAQPPR